MTKTHLFAALAVALAFPASALAQDWNTQDDRTEVSVSVFAPDIELRAKANLTANDGTTTETFSGSEEVSGGARGGMAEASFRLSERQRLVGSWYGVGRDDAWDYSGAGTVPDPDGGAPVDYAYSGRAELDRRFELYRLSYGYDLVKTPSFTTTALVGVYGAKLRLDANNSGLLEVGEDAYDLGAGGRFEKTSYAPGLGLAMTWRPADRWDVRVGAQGFETSWGNFDTDGHFVHANAQVGYRFARNWSAFAGYDFFELKLKERYSGQDTFDGITYAVEGPVSARLRVHGPTAGIRASF